MRTTWWNISWFTQRGGSIAFVVLTSDTLVREIRIGREYAYQIPAYYHALKAMARKRSLNISPGKVIKEATG